MHISMLQCLCHLVNLGPSSREKGERLRLEDSENLMKKYED